MDWTWRPIRRVSIGKSGLQVGQRLFPACNAAIVSAKVFPASRLNLISTHSLAAFTPLDESMGLFESALKLAFGDEVTKSGLALLAPGSSPGVAPALKSTSPAALLVTVAMPSNVPSSK